MKWLIVMPAWGERALNYFRTTSLPSVLKALEYSGIGVADGSARFIVHTDDPTQVRGILGDDAGTPAAPTGLPTKYHGLGYCHKQAIARAHPGECVAIINADHCVSVELFEACERRFAEGKKLIMAAGTRTLSDATPPIGARARDLLAWGWANRHPVITDAIWGSGRSPSLAVIHFTEGEDEVISRGFHLHPVAFVRQSGLKFSGLTIDEDLIDAFPERQIHVVTDADELGLIECSPADYGFPKRKVLINLRQIAFWAGRNHADDGKNKPRASAMHRWCFTHRISIKGTGKEIGDTAVANAVLDMLRGE